MPVKVFAVLRTHDGHAMDLLRPNAKAKAGVGGVVEVLAAGGGKPRVSVNGIELEGHPPQWPADLATPKADVNIEIIRDDAVVSTEHGSIEITGLSDNTPTPEPEPKPALDAE